MKCFQKILIEFFSAFSLENLKQSFSYVLLIVVQKIWIEFFFYKRFEIHTYRNLIKKSELFYT